MKTILTITGAAGTGKDTIARWLADHEGWNLVVSNTTRPMREGEVDGREHWFRSPLTPEGGMPSGRLAPPSGAGGLVLAYTVYGGYEYWTTWDQILDGTVNIYVIDENGLYDLLEARVATGRFNLITLHVTADEEVRHKRGVSDERMERDKTRSNPLTYYKYDFEIKNNKSMKALIHTLTDVVLKVKS